MSSSGVGGDGSSNIVGAIGGQGQTSSIGGDELGIGLGLALANGMDVGGPVGGQSTDRGADEGIVHGSSNVVGGQGSGNMVGSIGGDGKTSSIGGDGNTGSVGGEDLGLSLGLALADSVDRAESADQGGGVSVGADKGGGDNAVDGGHVGSHHIAVETGVVLRGGIHSVTEQHSRVGFRLSEGTGGQSENYEHLHVWSWGKTIQSWTVPC